MATKPFASSADHGVKEQTLEVLADGVYALAAATLREALGARPDEAWLLRPDAHVPADVTTPADLACAVARAHAMPEAASGS